MVVVEPQQFLDETGCLDPFKSGIWTDYGTESALVEDLSINVDKRSVSLLVLLELSLMAFNSINHGVLLQHLSDLGVGSMVLQWKCPSCPTDPRKWYWGIVVSAHSP